MTTDIIESGSHRRAAGFKKWGRKRTIATVAAVLVIAGGGTAWAAYLLYGFGTITSNKAVTQGLVVDNASAQLTKKLVPGQTVGAKAVVQNPNDFPVKVTGVIVRTEGQTVNPNTPACQTTVKVEGTGTTWPGEGGGPATAQPVVGTVVIAPGGSEWVTVAEAVSQDAGATELCGFSAQFAVKAETTS